ncbi:22394_t:CDS:2 [Racocetra persica]|uniref:22394_t:CDS:1 n=1 Tax=Racocetra persica TaxID=160502 RepID=A0ACA9NU94_9GLOM|nr:22394_t:CDS:2 [Racocetra persica]
MLEKLNQYIVYIYDEAAFIVSVLDPRIKLELMPVNMNIPENCDFFNHIFQDYSVSELNINTVSNTKKLSNSMIYMEQVAQKRQRANVLSSSSPTDELSQYLTKDFLAIQATSVLSEQIFSKIDDTVRVKRVRFSEKSIQALMCTGSWLEHGIRFQRD